jgi:hypothetical protein
LLSEAKSKA